MEEEYGIGTVWRDVQLFCIHFFFQREKKKSGINPLDTTLINLWCRGKIMIPKHLVIGMEFTVNPRLTAVEIVGRQCGGVGQKLVQSRQAKVQDNFHLHGLGKLSSLVK